MQANTNTDNKIIKNSNNTKVSSDDTFNFYLQCDNPLYTAAGDGALDVVKFLVEKGADIIEINKAMITASNGGEMKTVRYLLDNKADIHFNEDELLKTAVSEGIVESVELILSWSKFLKQLLISLLKIEVDSYRDEKERIHKLINSHIHK